MSRLPSTVFLRYFQTVVLFWEGEGEGGRGGRNVFNTKFVHGFMRLGAPCRKLTRNVQSCQRECVSECVCVCVCVCTSVFVCLPLCV